MLEITLKAPVLETIKSNLNGYEKKSRQILMRVINRAIVNVQKNSIAAARKRYIVKVSDIKKTLKISKATAVKPTAQLKSIGKRIFLYKFRVSPKMPRPSRPPRAYKAKVLKKSVLKPITGAFVAQMKSGHTGIFQRNNKKRLPINELVGPAVPQMIGNEAVIKKIEQEAQNTINKRLQHELKRMI